MLFQKYLSHCRHLFGFLVNRQRLIYSYKTIETALPLLSLFPEGEAKTEAIVSLIRYEIAANYHMLAYDESKLKWDNRNLALIPLIHDDEVRKQINDEYVECLKWVKYEIQQSVYYTFSDSDDFGIHRGYHGTYERACGALPDGLYNN